MTPRLATSLVLLTSVIALGLHVSTTDTRAGSAETTRTFYIAAVDAKGTAVSDLTAADVTVKEGGKDREVKSLQLTNTPMTLSIIVDDQGTGAFQLSVQQLLQAVFGKAQIAISALTPQAIKLTDYTEDPNALRTALGRLGQRGKIQPDGEQVIAGIEEASKELQKRKPERPVIVVLTVSGETALSPKADQTMTDLRLSGAALHVVYLSNIELGRVLGDGPKQSGGSIQSAATGTAMAPAVGKVIDVLQHQYALTYTLPDGVKPSDRLEVKTSRKGLTLLAPMRVPDK